MSGRAGSTRKLNRRRTTNSISASPGEGSAKTIRTDSSGAARAAMLASYSGFTSTQFPRDDCCSRPVTIRNARDTCGSGVGCPVLRPLLSGIALPAGFQSRNEFSGGSNRNVARRYPCLDCRRVGKFPIDREPQVVGVDQAATAGLFSAVTARGQVVHRACCDRTLVC
jgi:hypothetical protein